MKLAYNEAMKHIGSDLKKTLKKSNETERGEIMQYFCRALNSTRIPDGLPPISMGRMGKLLQQIPTKDLYYLKKVCDDAQNFSKKFWWEIKPENHTEAAKKAAAEKFEAMKRQQSRSRRFDDGLR